MASIGLFFEVVFDPNARLGGEQQKNNIELRALSRWRCTKCPPETGGTGDWQSDWLRLTAPNRQSEGFVTSFVLDSGASSR